MLQVQHALELIALVIELAGVAIIVVSVVWSTAVYLRSWRRDEAYHAYRVTLARGILLGLELLVGADIIETIAVQPSYDSLGVLALIVLIRTFLSFTLSLEIHGRWPWQQGASH